MHMQLITFCPTGIHNMSHDSVVSTISLNTLYMKLFNELGDGVYICTCFLFLLLGLLLRTCPFLGKLQLLLWLWQIKRNIFKGVIGVLSQKASASTSYFSFLFLPWIPLIKHQAYHEHTSYFVYDEGTFHLKGSIHPCRHGNEDLPAARTCVVQCCSI